MSQDYNTLQRPCFLNPQKTDSQLALDVGCCLAEVHRNDILHYSSIPLHQQLHYFNLHFQKQSYKLVVSFSSTFIYIFVHPC